MFKWTFGYHVPSLFRVFIILTVTLTYLCLSLICTYCLLYLLFTDYEVIPLIYIGWKIYNKDKCYQGGRLENWIRGHWFWTIYASHFNLHLHKSVNLSDEENYVFGHHSTGKLGLSAILNFGTEATGFSQIFPRIKAKLAIPSFNFWIPLAGEKALLSGFCNSGNCEGLYDVLSKCGKGNAVVITVGKGQEVDRRTMQLFIKQRKGFVRLAIQSGSSLVPCITFGENDVFVQRPEFEDSFLQYSILRPFMLIVTASLAFFNGQGLLTSGLINLFSKGPIHTIVGKPIQIVQNIDPTSEEVDSVHQKYMDSLRKLFEESKIKYAANLSMTIEFK